jgi:hypothetical protein
MATGTNTSTSRVVTILVLIPFLLLAWYLAPYVLPVYQWRYVDFAAIAKQSGIPESELRTPIDFIIRYHPRGPQDPCPWQISSSSPTWGSLDPQNLNEDSPPLLVRCILVSAKDGQGISAFWIGGTPEERYFKVHGYRLPGGSLGKPGHRPVVLFDSWSKLSIGDGIVRSSTDNSSENDDAFARRRDDYQP